MNFDSVIREHVRDHVGMMNLFGLDTNQDEPELFNTAKLKVLCVFLSSLETRSCSSTYTCISTLMRDKVDNDDLFIDACWYPDRELRTYMKEQKIPLMVGCISHHDWSDYDVICISNAISPEAFNVPCMYHNSGFPLTNDIRFKDDNAPLVVYGGAAASSMFAILGGNVKDQGKSYYDIGMLGAGEPILPELFKHLVDFNDEYCSKRLLFPWMYEFEYKEDNCSIKSYKRLDPRIPEKVMINRVQYPTFKGFNKKFFYPNGDNSSSHDIQISSGCSSFCCSFCSEGQEAGHWTEKPIEQIESDMQISKRYSAANTYSPFSFNSNYYGAYYDMLKLFIDNGSAISLLNQRADVLGSDEGMRYLSLAKKLGLIRASLAIEGCGHRVRNIILNKNLPREVLVAAARNVFKQKLIMMKTGL